MRVHEGEIYECGCTSVELSLGICFIFYFTVCLVLLSERQNGQSVLSVAQPD